MSAVVTLEKYDADITRLTAERDSAITRAEVAECDVVALLSVLGECVNVAVHESDSATEDERHGDEKYWDDFAEKLSAVTSLPHPGESIRDELAALRAERTDTGCENCERCDPPKPLPPWFYCPECVGELNDRLAKLERFVGQIRKWREWHKGYGIEAALAALDQPADGEKGNTR